MPRVSILLPVFNGEKFLPRAVQSVLNQAFADFELVIINDGSTDGSGKLIDGFIQRDHRIRQIVHENNKGLIASLNDGLNAARGEFIARIDCDDEWVSSLKLQKQVEVLDLHSEIGMVGTFAKIVSDNGAEKVISYPTSDRDIRKQILVHNCFVHSSVLCRRELLLACGGYKMEEKHVEDYGLWLRAGQRQELCNLPEIMVNYYLNPSGISQQNRLEQITAAGQLVAKFKGIYPNYYLAALKWRVQKFLARS